MHFLNTNLHGVWLIEPNLARDERGFFARTFCHREFEEQGLETAYVQQNVSSNAKKGTVRGMHWQDAPHGEVKIVSCMRGSIHDVVIDLRPWSPTFRRWQGFELSESNHRQLYIPQGFAHGFQTLCDDTLVCYAMSNFYAPEAARGLRHDDPSFKIAWPLPVAVVSEKDRSWKPFQARNLELPSSMARRG